MEQEIINTQAKLSDHFTLGEMIKTKAKGLDNTPPHAAVINLKNLCENWLEDLRYSYNMLYGVQTREGQKAVPTREGQAPLCSAGYAQDGASPCVSAASPCVSEEPIIINSGYRSEAVNKAVGGEKESNHLTGCAVDIKCFGIEQAIRYACILLDIADGKKQEFDELLIERSPKGTYWIHFAARPSGNRRKTKFIQT